MGILITVSISAGVWLFALLWYMITDYLDSRYTNRWFLEFHKLSEEHQKLKEELNKYRWKYGKLKDED